MARPKPRIRFPPCPRHVHLRPDFLARGGDHGSGGTSAWFHARTRPRCPYGPAILNNLCNLAPLIRGWVYVHGMGDVLAVYPHSTLSLSKLYMGIHSHPGIVDTYPPANQGSEVG